ncbi:selenium-binding family protein [Paracoccaceae bacterium]|jgi:selenium-binding protein 1|nr:selenium-binding family protein [Paracoccaceae bacterium]MDB4229404.1 selenium-binding family protein [Paracoccaceae bacterium]|tara:strand:- start:6402 stop:7802 length:1401 start_codon:yes stop_codon:yes gene_type:complete
MNLRPDPTFHATAELAMKAPAEKLAFTLMLSPDGTKPDGLAVIDVDPKSKTYSKILHSLFMPNLGDEFHHFGWNACSASLSPLTGHAFLERRYLIIPGIKSSRIYIIDVKEPLKAKIHKIIEADEIMAKTGYSRPHTIHCGPEGIYVSTLGGGGKDGTDGPPGIFIMDCETFDILGRYEMDRGAQEKGYDFWWNLPRNYMVSSEWGLPPQYENGIVAEDLLSNKYGHSIHFWDLRARKNVQTIDLGANHQMALEIRPAHDPVKEYGFCGVVVDTSNLEGAVFTWWRKEDGTFEAKKTITIPPVAADPNDLPELLKGFSAVPPLVTDIDLSLDDKYLYVACWGTGEMHQYDVSDPMNPVLNGKVEIGGIVTKTKHKNGKEFGYGPQMLEVSRDGKRVYWTNSLYSSWDDQFYPGERGGAMVMADVAENGDFSLNKDFWVEFPEGYRSHQIRLEGGDCSTDSFCYPSV